jgi:hypothetical protein
VFVAGGLDAVPELMLKYFQFDSICDEDILVYTNRQHPSSGILQ